MKISKFWYILAIVCMLTSNGIASETPDSQTICIGLGLSHLFKKQFQTGLDLLEDVELLTSEKEPLPEELYILNLVGQIVAHDNLDNEETCRLLVEELETLLPDEEDVTSDTETTDCAKMMAYRIGSLVDLASSPCLKQTLIEIMAEWFRISPTHFFPDQDSLYVIQCSSSSKSGWRYFIYKLEQFGKRMYNIFIKIKEVWDFVDNILNEVDKQSKASITEITLEKETSRVIDVNT